MTLLVITVFPGIGALARKFGKTLCHVFHLVNKSCTNQACRYLHDQITFTLDALEQYRTAVGGILCPHSGKCRLPTGGCIYKHNDTGDPSSDREAEPISAADGAQLDVYSGQQGENEGNWQFPGAWTKTHGSRTFESVHPSRLVLAAYHYRCAFSQAPTDCYVVDRCSVIK